MSLLHGACCVSESLGAKGGCKEDSEEEDAEGGRVRVGREGAEMEGRGLTTEELMCGGCLWACLCHAMNKTLVV